MATNELVLADARSRGITVPTEEQDSIRGLIRQQLTQLARQAGLAGEPQEGEDETEAVDRRVRSLLEGILEGRNNLLPLGALPYVLREEVEWHVYERAFPEVVEQLEERREAEAGQRPSMPPVQDRPQVDDTTPSVTPPDTAGTDTAG